jgi:hypothetical protein
MCLGIFDENGAKGNSAAAAVVKTYHDSDSGSMAGLLKSVDLMQGVTSDQMSADRKVVGCSDHSQMARRGNESHEEPLGDKVCMLRRANMVHRDLCQLVLSVRDRAGDLLEGPLGWSARYAGNSVVTVVFDAIPNPSRAESSKNEPNSVHFLLRPGLDQWTVHCSSGQDLA